MCGCVCVCVCVCVRVCVYVCIYVSRCMDTPPYIHTYIHTYTHTIHTYIHSNKSGRCCGQRTLREGILRRDTPALQARATTMSPLTHTHNKGKYHARAGRGVTGGGLDGPEAHALSLSRARSFTVCVYTC